MEHLQFQAHNLPFTQNKAIFILDISLQQTCKQIITAKFNRFNNSLIICYGRTITDAVFTLPISFTTPFSVVALHIGTGATSLAFDYNYAQSLTQLNFLRSISTDNLYLSFVCIGY